jgi:hypothetical protein
MHLLCIFEFYKINKVGGINSPYINMEWPWGIHIPQAILNLLDLEEQPFDFTNDVGEREEHMLLLYERNSARRDLKLNDSPEDKSDFVKYVVEFRCLNLIADTKKHPLPPLEELAKGANMLMAAGLQPYKAHRKVLKKKERI